MPCQPPSAAMQLAWSHTEGFASRDGDTWRCDMRRDILMLQDAGCTATGAALPGGGVGSSTSAQAAKLLEAAEREHADDDTALRLAYSDLLLRSMATFIHSRLALHAPASAPPGVDEGCAGGRKRAAAATAGGGGSAGAAAAAAAAVAGGGGGGSGCSPARALTTLASLADPKPEVPAQDTEAQHLRNRVTTLERISQEQQQHLEASVRRLRQADEARQEYQHEIATLSLSLARETQRAHSLQAALRSAQPAAAAASAPGSDGDDANNNDPTASATTDSTANYPTRRASGIHRLFSTTATATLSGAEEVSPPPPPPPPPRAEVEEEDDDEEEDDAAAAAAPSLVCGEEEVFSELRGVDALSAREKRAVARDVARDVNAALRGVCGAQRACEAQAARGARRLRGVIRAGVELAGETRRRTDLLAARCRALEKEVAARGRRVDVLERHLCAVGGAGASAEALRKLVDGAAEDRKERLDDYVAAELQSLRDAFSLKLALANDEMEGMARRHKAQLGEAEEKAEAEKAELRRVVQTLQRRVQATL